MAVRLTRGHALPGAVVGVLTSEGLQPHSWSNGPHFEYAEHAHPYHKVLYCTAGSIVFRADGAEFELGPGDRLEIEPGTAHGATVGPSGVTCVEAPR